MNGALIFADDWRHVPELLSTSASLGLNPLLIMSHEDLVNVEGASRYGVSEIITYRSPPIPTYISKILTHVVAEKKPRLVVGEAKKNVREIFGRAAQRIGAACANNCINIEKIGENFRICRPVLGGGYIATQDLITCPVFVTLQPDAFKSTTFMTSKNPVITSVNSKNIHIQGDIEIIEKRLGVKSGADLSSADRVVAVGKGFRKKKDLNLAEELSRLIGAEMGCSRPISGDLNWLPDDRHIGLSGNWIRASIYIAIGISGQIQHTIGIKNAKTIIAINNDPNAPIHKEADYSVIADLYEFLPVLIKKLKEQQYQVENNNHNSKYGED